jgi:hypothetical protein
MSQQQAITSVRRFWEAVAARDFATCGQHLADNVLRIGPRQMEDDTIEGRDAYLEFLVRVISAMPSYRNVTHDLTASADGSRVYIQCTEWSSPGSGSAQEVEVPLCMVCDLDDDALITKIDIYWKTPTTSVDWTLADNVLAD